MSSKTDLAVDGPVLTPDLAARLLQAAASGLFPDGAAEACGLDPETLDLWLRTGLSPGAPEPYRTFALTYRAQEHVPEVEAIRTVRDAATTDPKIALAFLAARYPSTWGPKATRARSAGDVKPAAQDLAAEEAMVATLLEAAPPELVRLLEQHGWARTQPKR